DRMVSLARGGAGVGDEIAQIARRTRETAHRIERTHEIPTAIIRSDRLDDEHVALVEAAARREMIGPDFAARAVKQSATVPVGDTQPKVALDRHAALRRAGDTARQLGGHARNGCRRGRRARTKKKQKK